MKKIILFLAFISLLITSCTPAGTVNHLGTNNGIEVYEYYPRDGICIYVARFVDCPGVTTTTWNESHGKSHSTEANITVNEN